MNRFIPAILFTLTPALAHASYFEFCLLQGTVESLVETSEHKVKFNLLVNDASITNLNGNPSYPADCEELYKGKTIEVTLANTKGIIPGKNVSVVQAVIEEQTRNGVVTRVSYKQKDKN